MAHSHTWMVLGNRNLLVILAIFTIVMYGESNKLNKKSLSPSTIMENSPRDGDCSHLWDRDLHDLTVAIDQSRGNPPGEGPVPASVYVNKPLQILHHLCRNMPKSKEWISSDSDSDGSSDREVGLQKCDT